VAHCCLGKIAINFCFSRWKKGPTVAKGSWNSAGTPPMFRSEKWQQESGELRCDDVSESELLRSNVPRTNNRLLTDDGNRFCTFLLGPLGTVSYR